MSTMMRVMFCGPLLAMVVSIGACDEGDGVELDDAGLEDEDLEDEDLDVELRELCIYAGPQPTDDSASIAGALDEVETYEEADAFPCDLRMFRVTAAPPSNRARTVSFHAHSYDGFSHKGARLWGRTCTGGVCSGFSPIAVALTVVPGLCPDPNIVCVPSLVGADITLPANNTYTDIRAGMRVIDGDGDIVPVSITVSE